VQRWGEGDLSVRVTEEGQDEVADLSKRFNASAERIEKLVRSHKSLLANASHELRSPLTRIRMGLELMGDRPSPAAREEISRNIGELDQLIDEILLASRLDASEADMGTIEAVDLTGLAAEECSQVNAELDLVEGTDNARLTVPGVSRLLRRAIRNLLENARRYGNGDIRVELGSANGFATVRVTDRGPGVPPALRERIFEPFYRLPGASERNGGVGLGLALVKSIAERHGGSVRCEDGPEGGASFVIRRRRAFRQRAGASQVGATRPHLKSRPYAEIAHRQARGRVLGAGGVHARRRHLPFGLAVARHHAGGRQLARAL
jgi:two-component system OmpR family sensor kinase